MKLVELQFLGVHMMEPEDFLCALLADPASSKLVPVWMSLADGARLSSRADGYNPTRPDTHDLLIELMEAQGGLSSAVINNVHEGVFYVEITTGQGTTLDARVSDAVALTLHFEAPLTIDEEILGKVGLYVSEDDLDQYFDIDYSATSFTPGQSSRPEEDDSSSTSASGDAQADADFSALMQSMGISEEELRLEEDAEGAEDKASDADVDEDEDIWGDIDDSKGEDSKEDSEGDDTQDDDTEGGKGSGR